MLINKLKQILHFSALFTAINFNPSEATLYQNTLGSSFFQYVQTLSPQKFGSPTRECVLDIIRNLNSSNLAFQLSDSWGSIPSGLKEGNHISYGSFDECLKIGKYCLANIPVSAVTDSSLLQEQLMSIGICVPSICSGSSLNTLLVGFLTEQSRGQSFDNTNIVRGSSCSIRQESEIPLLAWLTLGIFLFFVLISLLCTVYHFKYVDKEKSLNQYLVAFSIYKNSKQLFQISENTSKTIPCINGIRVLSTIWIVYGHCYMMTMVTDNAINATYIKIWLQQFYVMLWHNFAIAVDTFLYMSGFLFAVSAFNELEKTKGRLNILTMYLCRYLRLTPVLLAAMLFYMTWFRLLGSGPQWKNFTSSSDFCTDNWWTNLLYIQNYVAVGRLCLGHAWYLSVDMQLFLISPALVYVIWRFQKRGVFMITVLTILFTLLTFCIIYFGDLKIFYPEGNLGQETPSLRYFYLPTHTRTSAWFIGILFAYFLHTKKAQNSSPSFMFIMLSWLLTALVLGLIIFGLYPKIQPGSVALSPLESGFYGSLSRLGWPLALCWITYACIHGYAGWVDSILSWKFWQPLAKLSYAIYLWHLIIIMMIEGGKRINTYFSDFDMMFYFLGIFVLSTWVSICSYLFVEGPFNNLCQMLKQKKPKLLP